MSGNQLALDRLALDRPNPRDGPNPQDGPLVDGSSLADAFLTPDRPRSYGIELSKEKARGFTLRVGWSPGNALQAAGADELGKRQRRLRRPGRLGLGTEDAGLEPLCCGAVLGTVGRWAASLVPSTR